MIKYKVGDKVVLTVTGTNEMGCYYVLNDRYNILEESIDKYAEPLTTYTEPLESKIHRQAAEITRLLAENKELKEDFEKSKIVNLNMGRLAGQNEAWELARKCMLMTDREREAIFGSGHNALYGVLTYFDCKHAAAKVAEWEKAKEIKVGDVVRDKCDTSSKFCVTQIDYCDGQLYGVGRYGLTYSNQDPKNWEKTGRHMDIDGFLKQIGGGDDEK